ncbi:guanine nucleotide binding protein, alpha subunit [Absidia repens]|uniref:Guanine nucleotide binding protein, alpha subunit n=1 Tax=Absidia repens TaxID=90262 RepID=A0A1X2IS51_9FUNG|nr:guanine nucleotide binding protein, alpha subunit [Absidia repens]
MGCCHSNNQSVSAEFLHNEEIDQVLRAEKIKHQHEAKLLLLGSGESGKSTLVKQIRLIHDNGFTNAERQAFREVVAKNLLQSMVTLLEAVDQLNLGWQMDTTSSDTITTTTTTTTTKNAIDVNSRISNNNSDTEAIDCATMLSKLQQHANGIGQGSILLLPMDLVETIDRLWHHPTIQHVYRRKNEYQLNDSAAYYFDAVHRIGDPRFIPTDLDILYARVKTTGITETKFSDGKQVFRVFDVGGQRSERKKWIHCFENVTALLYMVALSEYDQVLFEDPTVNRLTESLQLYASICNSKWFRQTSFILLFNKTDLFKQKWSRTTFKTYFGDYQGPSHYKGGYQYIQKKFLDLKPKTPDTQVYTHFTCATDTEHIKFVLIAVTDVILQQNMRSGGLLD